MNEPKGKFTHNNELDLLTVLQKCFFLQYFSNVQLRCEDFLFSLKGKCFVTHTRSHQEPLGKDMEEFVQDNCLIYVRDF
jgi:hypothetical protein